MTIKVGRAKNCSTGMHRGALDIEEKLRPSSAASQRSTVRQASASLFIGTLATVKVFTTTNK